MSGGISEERLKALYDIYVTNEGRPLAELLETRGPLKGAEAQRLRGHFTSYGLHPVDCKDFELVAALMTGNLKTIKERFEEAKTHPSNSSNGQTEQEAISWFESFRDSPNQLPVYDILQVGAFTGLMAEGSIRPNYYDTLNWLIQAGISVEGEDVAGYTALQHSLTCTPLAHDFQWSETLLKASKTSVQALNHRNRYGSTCTHEMLMSFKREGEEEIRLGALQWALEKGANVDIPDHEGCTARSLAKSTPSFLDEIQKADEMITKRGGCAFCRRGGLAITSGKEMKALEENVQQLNIDGKGTSKEGNETGSDKYLQQIKANMRCSRCKNRLYCSAACQKMDWPHHKLSCKSE